jgi:lambda family phage portal protein
VQGEIVEEISPGAISLLPPGFSIQPLDFQHPKTTFPDFVKAILRGVASGLGVSYVSLANDLESVNYSSARVGLLEEREYYKTVQRLLKETFLKPMFWKWYMFHYENGRFDRLNIEVDFVGRKFDWVDPLKDVEAQARLLDLGLVSYSEILKAQGKDLEDHLNQLEKEKKLLAEKNLRPPIWGLK